MPQSLHDMGAQIILGNTFHLWMRPGLDVMEKFGGLHQFEKWDKPILTDSGGFQVWSLGQMRKISEEGVRFSSPVNGDKLFLTPEVSMQIQTVLNSDIVMQFDECTPYLSVETATKGQITTEREARVSMELSLRWAARCKTEFARLHNPNALFGIVQGGMFEHLREESLAGLEALDFPGIAVGGLSVGETRAEMLPPLAVATDLLPADQPRYFMGLGDPAGIVEVVALGVDMFDCVLPTRLARHGTLLTSAGRLNIKRAEFARDDGPLDPTMPDSPVARFSRGYLRHLFTVDEPTAAHLLTLHNLYWLLHFVDDVRASIRAGRFERFRAEVLEVWG
jgi:queuine tRNA-ribosyltransferase